MSTEIYYFSGTGNSLFVAEELLKRLPESKLIPVVSLLNLEVIETEAETVGIVFPLQGPIFPNAVKKFLQKADMKSADYIFAVATRGGTSCRIKTEMDKILKKKNKQLSAHFIMTVFNNNPKLKSDNHKCSFHILSEELTQKTEEIRSKLDSMREIIIRKEISHRNDTEYDVKMGFVLERLILLAMKTQEQKSIKDYFYTDSKCTGCGLCEKVCLSNKIEMKNGKPCWQDNKPCYMCYACLNYCPAESVQIHSKWFMKSYTVTQRRYSHPYASVADIAKQKHYVSRKEK